MSPFKKKFVVNKNLSSFIIVLKVLSNSFFKKNADKTVFTFLLAFLVLKMIATSSNKKSTQGFEKDLYCHCHPVPAPSFLPSLIK